VEDGCGGLGVRQNAGVSKIRILLPTALLLVLAACGAGRPDPNAVAAAKCHLPLQQKLELPDEQDVATSDVAVRRLGDGRREVTGSFTVSPGGRSGSFVCVVTPDASDQLRGLRVERLEVQ
jgi:hypothetical protein